MRKRIAALAVLSSASIAWAEGIIYDGFEYDATGNPPLGIGPSNLAGSFGQWRYQGNNTNEPRLFDGSISYPGLPPSPGNKVQLDNNNGQAGAGANAARLYVGTRDNVNYPTLYYSFVTTIPSSTNANQNGAYFAGFDNLTAAASYTTFGGLFVRQNALDTTDIDLGISTSGSQNRVWTGALPNDTPLFVVGSFTFGGASTLDVFVDPAAIPFTEPPTHLVVSAGNDASAVTEVTNFYLRGNLGEPDAIEVDEVRIGASWTDVASRAFYWDINGDTPGAGGTAPSGNWDGLAANFNTDPAGGAGTITQTTRAFDSVNFSAANEGTGNYTVNVTGTQAALVNVTGGNVTFEGGTLAVGRFDITPGASATVNSTVIGAPMGVAKAGGGTLTLQGTNSWTGATHVSGGTLIIEGDLMTSSAVAVTGGTLQHQGNLTTSAVAVSGGMLQQQGHLAASTSVTVTGGTLRLDAGGGSSRILSTPSLSVSGTGRIDLTDNKLIVPGGSLGTWDGAAYTGLSGLVSSGRGTASTAQWDGVGIVTSDTRAINNGDLVSIGTARVADFKGVPDTETTTFAGQTVSGADVVAMVTWGGDANLDGKINIDDYGRIDGNVGQSGSVFGWFNGDFNYDGKINIDDYGIIDGNINRQGVPFSTATTSLNVVAIPEPAAAVVALAGLSVHHVSRRRRRRE